MKSLKGKQSGEYLIAELDGETIIPSEMDDVFSDVDYEIRSSIKSGKR